MKEILFTCFTCLLFTSSLFSQPGNTPHQDSLFWEIRQPGRITWDLAQEGKLPHGDNMEMSGERVSGIIHYTLDENKQLSLKRHIIFPQLRVFIHPGESSWRRYRAYLAADYEDDLLPTLVAGNYTFAPGTVDSVVIDGMLNFYHAPAGGLRLQRILCPSTTERLFVEHWTLTNTTDSLMEVKTGNTRLEQNQKGVNGHYRRVVTSDAPESVHLEAGESFSFGLYFSAYLNDEPLMTITSGAVVDERRQFLAAIRGNLILESPDPVVDQLFSFSKVRVAESIFATSMGLVNSPGGGRYYTGVWANDQAEYSGPFYPYLGYEKGHVAALNAYRVFLENIPEGDGHFWSSFEMDGQLTCCGADRGDAAMIAFGASHFCLANGQQAVAEELWPLIAWSLDYCERQKNEAGVIRSDSDEMEGRIPTGDANLSTSSLYYGALLLAADLGKELGIPKKQQNTYKKQARELAAAMETYFGATIEGLETYRYFDGHEHLRHWICLPLVMGISDRKEGTLDALFSKLWTNNGVRVEYNPDLPEPDLFWDRGTLYAFRGAFKAGGTDRGLEKLHAYSETRLLGFHVPYVVEAWPEGNMAHLSAESALYCRAITEGLLGINPTGLNQFEIAPHLPAGWDTYSLREIKAFGNTFDVKISREKEKVRVVITTKNKKVVDKLMEGGQTLRVSF